MSEEQQRAAVVTEAMSWIGTPYVSNAVIKGRKGGTDCAMVLVGVYGGVGLIPKEFDPRPYPPQWHVHKNEQKYVAYILQFSREVAASPEREPKSGDLVLFRIGHLFAHGGIVVSWPTIIHAVAGSAVLLDDVSKNTTGKHALWNMPKRFFSLWPEAQA